jgi:hypothetical protein
MLAWRADFFGGEADGDSRQKARSWIESPR